jgi:hypothetical protein
VAQSLAAIDKGLLNVPGQEDWSRQQVDCEAQRLLTELETHLQQNSYWAAVKAIAGALLEHLYISGDVARYHFSSNVLPTTTAESILEPRE